MGSESVCVCLRAVCVLGVCWCCLRECMKGCVSMCGDMCAWWCMVVCVCVCGYAGLVLEDAGMEVSLLCLFMVQLWSSVYG